MDALVVRRHFLVCSVCMETFTSPKKNYARNTKKRQPISIAVFFCILEFLLHLNQCFKLLFIFLDFIGISINTERPLTNHIRNHFGISANVCRSSF